jgi:hypothetical protein
MQKILDNKVWYVGKQVVIYNSTYGFVKNDVITKVGKHYVTALGFMFRVGNEPMLKQIGSAKISNYYMLCSKEYTFQCNYTHQVKSKLASMDALLENELLDLLLLIGDRLGIERPEHLRGI